MKKISLCDLLDNFQQNYSCIELCRSMCTAMLIFYFKNRGPQIQSSLGPPMVLRWPRPQCDSDTLKQVIIVIVILNKLENESNLVKNHLDGLSKGECFPCSVWSDNENGRKSDVQRRRDGHHRLTLLRIQLGVQAFGPTIDESK